MKIIKALVISFLAIACSVNSVTQEELLQYAINQNDSQLIEILFKYGNNYEKPMLNRAMEAKDYFAVFMLVEYGVDVNSRSGHPPSTNHGRSVLEMAIISSEVPLVELFLLHKADPTTSFKSYPERNTTHITTAVYDAIINNRLDVLILFAQNNIDLNKICLDVIGPYSQGYKQTPIQVAVEHKRKDIVAFLVSVGAKL